MAAAAIAIAPSAPLRFRPYSTLRFLASYSKTLHNPLPIFPPILRHCPPVLRRRFFSCAVFRDLAEKQFGSAVGEFRKKLKVADIKGGPDDGLTLVGQTLTVMGWVRTLRVQSSVTFIEVNDSCLSNMQCVMSSDAEGYDQGVYMNTRYFGGEPRIKTESGIEG